MKRDETRWRMKKRRRRRNRTENTFSGNYSLTGSRWDEEGGRWWEIKGVNEEENDSVLRFCRRRGRRKESEDSHSHSPPFFPPPAVWSVPLHVSFAPSLLHWFLKLLQGEGGRGDRPLLPSGVVQKELATGGGEGETGGGGGEEEESGWERGEGEEKEGWKKRRMRRTRRRRVCPKYGWCKKKKKIGFRKKMKVKNTRKKAENGTNSKNITVNKITLSPL
jgi:hypothetical protein